MGDEPMNRRIAIITYHGLRGAADNDDINRYNIPATVFAGQMRWLSRGGYHSMCLASVMEMQQYRFPQGNKVVITFDDGSVSNYEYALPVLEYYGLKAIFFVSTANIGTGSFMTWTQLKELYLKGHSVQSHGHRHRFLNSLSLKDLYEELKTSKDEIDRYIGESPVALSCPGGRYNKEVLAAAQDLGYRKVFTSEPDCLKTDKYAEPAPQGRYMITDKVDAADFEKIVTASARLYRRQKAVYTAKKIIKSIMGDRKYQEIFDKRQGT